MPINLKMKRFASLSQSQRESYHEDQETPRELTKHVCQKVDVDSLWHALGRFGRYQIIQLILIMVFAIPQTVAILSGMFTGKSVTSRCFVDNETTIMNNEAFNSIVDGHNFNRNESSLVNMTVIVSECSIKKTLSSPAFGDIVEEQQCSKFTYGTDTHLSFLSEWDLVCDQDAVGQLPQMLTMVGMVVGAATLPHAGDRFGRKTLAVWAQLAHFAVTLGIAYVPYFKFFLLLKFLSGVFNQGFMVPHFIMGLELFPMELRTFFGFVATIMWGISVVTLVPVAYLLRNQSWRTLQLAYACYSVSLLTVFALDETLRWLLANKKAKRANELLRKICRMNNKNFEEIIATCHDRKIEESRRFSQAENFVVPEQVPLDLPSSPDSVTNDIHNLVEAKKPTVPKAKPNLLDLFKNSIMRKISLIVCYAWMVNSLTYYGITLLSTSLAGDPYVNFLFGSIVELPSAVALYLALKRFGRKASVIGFVSIAGTSLLSAVLVATLSDGGYAMGQVQTALTLLGKFCISASFNLMWIYTPELYPTNIRNTGIGMSSTCARIAATASPFFGILAKKALWAPGALFSGCCFLCVFLLTFLPETGHRELPNTIEDVEAWFKKRQENGDIEKK